MVVIVTGSAFFDSNATRTNSLRNNAGHSKEDFLFPVGGVIDIVVPSGENVFALQGSVRYDFYSRNKDLSSQNINLRGDYRRTLNPCNIDLDGSLIHSLTDFANSADLTFQKNLQTIEQVEGTLTCGSATGLRPFATLNYTNARNSIVEREVNDYDNIVYGGGVALVDGSAGTLGVIGSLSRNIYPGRPSGGELGPRGVHVKSIGAYFQRSSARILQASVQLNYTVVSQASGTPPFHGLSGSVLVHYMPGGRIAFDAMVSRAVQTAFTNTASYTIETDYSLSAGAPINEKFRVAAFYLRQHRKYEGTIFSEHALLSDTLQSAGVNASYRLTRRISLSFLATYQQRRANDPVFNYSGVKTGIGVGVRL